MQAMIRHKGPGDCSSRGGGPRRKSFLPVSGGCGDFLDNFGRQFLGKNYFNANKPARIIEVHEEAIVEWFGLRHRS